MGWVWTRPLEGVTELVMDPTVLKEYMVSMPMQKETETLMLLAGREMEEDQAAGNQTKQRLTCLK